jgi:hypothetical protein
LSLSGVFVVHYIIHLIFICNDYNNLINIQQTWHTDCITLYQSDTTSGAKLNRSDKLTIKRKGIKMTNTKTNTNTASKNQNLETITAEEKKRLLSAEASIRAGLKAFYNVGRALSDIAQFRLYRSTHSTFATYCKEKWDMTTARASQLQHAYRVHALLTSLEIRPLPATESQCRPLARIPENEQMDAAIVEVWSAVIDSGQKVTAALVSKCVDDFLGIEPKQSSAGNTASDGAEGSDGAQAGATDGPSASAEMRAELRDARRKIAYLESQLEAERQAHKRTKAAGGVPQSAMAKKLYKAGFRAMAKTMHPDNGGSDADMQELNAIKEALHI